MLILAQKNGSSGEDITWNRFFSSFYLLSFFSFFIKRKEKKSKRKETTPDGYNEIQIKLLERGGENYVKFS